MMKYHLISQDIHAMALCAKDLPPVDLYALLGVDKNARHEEITKAYRRLALKCHPDLNHGNAHKTEIFRLATLAYDILSVPKKRQEYDRLTRPSLFSRMVPWASPKDPSKASSKTHSSHNTVSSTRQSVAA